MRKQFFGLVATAVVICSAVGLFGAPVRASEPTTDWVIRDYQTTWAINTDGSADVQETIKADVGQLPDKHGIFRVVPTKVAVGARPRSITRATPVTLVDSIRDEAGAAYSITTSTTSDTITWKIGGAATTVTGLHTYKIHYTMGNAVWRGPDSQRINVVLNVVGQFWTIPIDKVAADIVFPSAISAGDRTTLKAYVGKYGSMDNPNLTTSWTSANTLHLEYPQTLPPKQGVTIKMDLDPAVLSVPVQKASFWELYGVYMWYLWPLFLLVASWLTWHKYGQDIKVNKALMVQYEPPQDMRPLLLYQLQHNGQAPSQAITATVVDLAVRGYLKISNEPTKVLMFTSDKVSFELLKAPDDTLLPYEKEVLDGIFPSPKVGTVIPLSDLKNKFYTTAKTVTKSGKAELTKRKLFEDHSKKLAPYLLVSGLVVFATVKLSEVLSIQAVIASILGLVVVGLFMFLMPRKTADGSEMEYELRGFQDYLKTAEKYRLKWSEKENMFEKYLPYAVAFGLVTQWANAMRKVYGDDYWNSYHPLWYVGPVGSFAPDAFAQSLSSVTSQIGQSLTSAPSGSSGGGFSGGGSGGGGGGGW